MGRRNPYQKKIHILETQRDRRKKQLLAIKEKIRPINKILDQIKAEPKKHQKNEDNKNNNLHNDMDNNRPGSNMDDRKDAGKA